MADIDSLSLKELKELISSAGLSFADCLDKDDLRNRAREAQEAIKNGYDCIVSVPKDVLDGSAADLVVVMLHGLGATNSDLVPLNTMLSQLEPALTTKKIVWIFPQAPQTEIGNAWWTLDVASFMAATMNPNNEEMMARLIREQPPDLPACRARLATLIKEVRQYAGDVPCSKLLLGGFSLGAITSLDVALQQPAGETVAGVIVMNGAPIVVDQWALRLKEHPKLRVHMSAGLQDMMLPSQASDWAYQLLQSNGVDVKIIKHPGGHEIGGQDVLRSVASFVAASLTH